MASVAGSLELVLLLYDELLLDWLDSDRLRFCGVDTIFCSAFVCLLHFSLGLQSFSLTGDLGVEDCDDALSGEGLDVGDRGSRFREGDVTWEAESGETGWDLFAGEPGADFTELLGLCGDFGWSPADGGGDEYCSGCSGEPMFEAISLGDFGASGDLGANGEAGIEFSGELISEWAPLKLSGECGLLLSDVDLCDSWEWLSGEGDLGPLDLGEAGEWGGDLGSFLELSDDELRRLRELELLLLEDDWASPVASRESSESISEIRQ